MQSSFVFGIVIHFLFGLSSVTASPLTKDASTNTTCTSLSQRKAWHTLTTAEKAEYIRAEKCLMALPATANITGALNRWDELQYLHILQSNVIHYTGQFLPWHRYFMRVHEQLLQTECNYTGGQPYWDEQRDSDAGPLANASVFGTTDESFGRGDILGSHCVEDGPFANTTLRLGMKYGVMNYTEYCLSRNFTQTMWYQGNSTYAQACFETEFYGYNDTYGAYNCYRKIPHTAGHASIGGTMLEASGSPGDPLFFLHHTNLDRLWWSWQAANLSARLTDMGGRNVPGNDSLITNNWLYPSAAILDYDGDPANVTTLNHVLWMAGVAPNVTVADVMDIRGDTICAEYVEDDDEPGI